MLQGLYRKKASYKKWFNMKLELTSKAGVMMALSGTPQGMTGFYLNPSSNMVYYWVVHEDTGAWIQMGGEITFDEYKKTEAALRRKKEKAAADDESLVAYGGTDDGRAGYYMSSNKGRLGYYEPGAHGVLTLAEAPAAPPE